MGRAFCAGADLKEWNESNQRNKEGGKQGEGRGEMPRGGFGGLSRRMGRKPVIAAVNGLALGGGMEAVINTDLVVATRGAIFGYVYAKMLRLPEGEC